MKKIFILVLMLSLIPLIEGCGGYEKWKEGTVAYETLSGEKGELKLYSGGVLVAEYPEAKIAYSSSDTNSIIFKANGKKLYWQGEALFEFK